MSGRLLCAHEVQGSRCAHHCGHSTSWDLWASGLSDSGMARSGGILRLTLLFGGLGRGPSFATGSQKVTPLLRKPVFPFPTLGHSASPTTRIHSLFIPTGAYFQFSFFPKSSFKGGAWSASICVRGTLDFFSPATSLASASGATCCGCAQLGQLPLCKTHKPTHKHTVSLRF